jgi:hypothetical protein
MLSLKGFDVLIILKERDNGNPQLSLINKNESRAGIPSLLSSGLFR